MCAFFFAAGVAVINKALVENWGDDLMNGLLHHAVAQRQVLNVPLLWFFGDKAAIPAYSVSVPRKVVMNIQDVFKGIITKPHSLVVVALAFTDAAPRFFNIGVFIVVNGQFHAVARKPGTGPFDGRACYKFGMIYS